MLLFYAFSSIPSGRPPVDLVLRDYEVSSGSVGHVLVLSPLKNAQETLPIFFSNLEKMEYPRDKISVGFLVSDSVDNTIPMVEEYANRIQSSGKPFHKFTVLRKDYHFELGGDKARHEYDVQIKRRDIMARSRSFLLTSTLTPEIDWVLWMDSDVIEYQTTLIQDLIKWKSKGDVIGGFKLLCRYFADRQFLNATGIAIMRRADSTSTIGKKHQSLLLSRNRLTRTLF